jgi:enoyl-[acyl-carrier protein] reductase I
MVSEFKNQWAIILGGSSGLGLASAKKLAQQGMNICIIHRNSRTELPKIEEYFEEMKALEISFLNFNLDATNVEKRIECVLEVQSKIGNQKIKCLVHSIAKGSLKKMTGENSLTNDDFLITLNAMAISLYDWTKAVFDANLFDTDARIISFTSEGNTKPIQNYGAVSAAKVTLEAISRQIALEFAPFGIRSNCIQAGVTNTISFQMIPSSEKIKAYVEKRNPFKRLTNPEDVADVVYLLCKEEAKWITGTIIKVDGGESLQ